MGLVVASGMACFVSYVTCRTSLITGREDLSLCLSSDLSVAVGVRPSMSVSVRSMDNCDGNGDLDALGTGTGTGIGDFSQFSF